MTRTLRLKDLESAAANATEQPFFTTGASGRDGVRGTVSEPADPPAVGILFEEHFDDQPDFTSIMHPTSSDLGNQEVVLGDTLPNNWDKLFAQARWTPDTGYPDNHPSLEILAANSDKSRSGTGKSAVYWRESYGSSWNSDAQLIKLLDSYHTEIYAEFWMRFSPNWWQRDVNNFGPWDSKMFRIGSWSGTGEIWNSQGGEVGPRFFWGYKKDDYGLRSLITLKEGPHGSNTDTSTGGQGSLNYKNHIEGMGVNGSDPEIPDLINGGFIKDAAGSIEHEQVFGTADVWTKMGFYLKVNSEPGAPDGILRMWINDVQFWNDTGITWYDTNSTPEQMVGWNYFAIGGNDYFGGEPRENLFEDWWALDDLVVRDNIPEDLL